MNLYRFFLLMPILFITSCSTQPPNEVEIKNLVKQWYDQQSTGDGAGRWEVLGVSVLSVKEDAARKDVFKTVNFVNGKHYPAATAEPGSPVEFSDTLRMDLKWNGAKWVTAE